MKYGSSVALVWLASGAGVKTGGAEQRLQRARQFPVPMMSPVMTNSNSAATTLTMALAERFRRMSLMSKPGRTHAIRDCSDRHLLVSNLDAAAVAW